MTAADLITELGLLPHPEGGYYKEVYRSSGMIKAHTLPSSFGGDRNYATSIYYLLQQGDYSAFHRIKSDEIWHFYGGGTLVLHVLHVDGRYKCIQLGNDLANGASFQAVMPPQAWFAAEPADGTAFTLAGCTVAPGFDFQDFEMAKRDDLIAIYPDQEALIQRLTRM